MRTTQRRIAAVAAAATVTLALSACGSSFDDKGSGAAQKKGKASLSVLVATSGTADLQAVKDAAKAYGAASGNTVKVTAAQDMAQQLSQGFASNKPPDVFMVDASQLVNYASAGDLYAYGDQLPMKEDFYPALRQTFTYNGKLQCAPKDSSTLALIVNTDLWKKAGLTQADVPKTWGQLETVAKKLTSGGVTGLGLGDTRDRIGAFMVESGGWITNANQTQVTADSTANLRAIQYVQRLLKEGVAKYPKALDSGWSGEALGKGKAAMVVEGNWIRGGMKDFPSLNYTAYEMPAGPAGKGTLSFTQCWGVAAASQYKSQAVGFVKSLMTVKQQITFAKAFGVMPSLQSAQSAYEKQFPQDNAFLAGVNYAQGPVNAKGMDSVLADFDTGLQSLPQASPASILQRLQSNGTAVLKQ